MKQIKKLDIKKIESPGGNLSYFEKGKDITFDIKRIYYIYDFCEENKRGFHAHKELKQVMWCPYGIIEIYFDNGEIREKYILDEPNKILIVEDGYWREFVSLKEKSILCVAASNIYDESDYIRDYEEYLIWRKEKKNENTLAMNK